MSLDVVDDPIASVNVPALGDAERLCVLHRKIREILQTLPAAHRCVALSDQS